MTLPNAIVSVTSIEATGAMGRSLVMDDEGHQNLHLRFRPGALSSEEESEGRHVHKESKELFKRCGGRMNCIRYIPIYGEAIECYSLKVVFTLCSTYALSKGIAYVLIMTALNPMFMRRFDSGSTAYQRYYTVSRMGWSIKPFTALFSDSIAFFGYKKRWFLAVSAFFGFGCSIVFALLPAKKSSASIGAVMAFLVGYGQANLDILSEGLYSRKMRQFPSGGPSLVSSIWIVQMIAGIVASLIQGPLSDAGIPQVGLFICGGCMFFCIPLYLLNWLDESRNREERQADAVIINEKLRKLNWRNPDNDELDANLDGKLPEQSSISVHEDLPEELYIPTYCGGAIEFNKEVLVRNSRITIYCVVMTVVVVMTAVVTLNFGTYAILGMVIGASILLNGMLFWSLPFVVAKAGLFGFVNQALYVNIGSALDSFYLGGSKCNPGGPNFSYFFYNTISGVVGYVAGALGCLGFAYLFSKRTYRLTFIITISAEIIGSVFDLIMVRRWNLPAIPDHYMYVFGDAVVYQVAYMLAWMPMCVLLAQLCPRGSEAMVYALLAALSNYGQTISAEIGELLMEWVWPVPANLNTQVCDFHHLWKLILTGHMILPCFIMVSVFFLIPSARICDELDENGEQKPAVPPADTEE